MHDNLDQIETRDVWHKDRKHVLHPWTHFDSFREEGSLAIVRGEGCSVFDSDGKQYVDAVGGLWCNNIGLGREEMAEAIAAQVRRLSYANTFCDMTSAPAAELAAVLAELAPSNLCRIFYTTGGST
ncbi:MAG: aminotransferase class III-fold pyridoxal phosphate-dependent enzyme, partial [Planctomycetota bacterium]